MRLKWLESEARAKGALNSDDTPTGAWTSATWSTHRESTKVAVAGQGKTLVFNTSSDPAVTQHVGRQSLVSRSPVRRTPTGFSRISGELGEVHPLEGGGLYHPTIGRSVRASELISVLANAYRFSVAWYRHLKVPCALFMVNKI